MLFLVYNGLNLLKMQKYEGKIMIFTDIYLFINIFALFGILTSVRPTTREKAL